MSNRLSLGKVTPHLKKIVFSALCIAAVVGTRQVYAGGAWDGINQSSYTFTCSEFSSQGFTYPYTEGYVGVRVWNGGLDSGTPLIDSFEDHTAQGAPALYEAVSNSGFGGGNYSIGGSFAQQAEGSELIAEVYYMYEPSFGSWNESHKQVVTFTCASAASPTPTPSPTATPTPSVSPAPTQTSATNFGPTSEAPKPAPPACGAVLPSTDIELFQIDARSTSAKLYFTPGGDNTAYYYISYGYDVKAEAHGTEVPFTNRDGVMVVDINHLQPGTTYYFKLRPGNGCVSREWSKVLKITTPKSGSAIKSFYLYN